MSYNNHIYNITKVRIYQEIYAKTRPIFKADCTSQPEWGVGVAKGETIVTEGQRGGTSGGRVFNLLNLWVTTAEPPTTHAHTAAFILIHNKMVKH